MELFNKNPQSKVQGPKNTQKVDKGISLLEALAAMTIVLVVVLGLLPLLDVGTRTTEVNQREIEVLNASRQKLEEIHQIMSYDSVGIIVATSGDVSGAGYFETDPIYAGSTFDNEDFLLSDSIPLTFGTATRTVTIEAIDDSADNTGAKDWDQIYDPNTGTILDYKLVKVMTTTLEPVTNRVLQGEVVSILRGFLDSEIDGSTGEDSGSGTDPDKKGTKDPPKAKKGTDGTGHDSGEGVGRGRGGKSSGTDDRPKAKKGTDDPTEDQRETDRTGQDSSEDSGDGTDSGKKGTKDPTKGQKGPDGTGHDSREGAGKGHGGKSGGTVPTVPGDPNPAPVVGSGLDPQ